MTATRTAAIQAVLADTQTAWGASRFAEAARCGEAHRLRYVVRLRPRRYEDPDFGESGGEPSYFAIGRLLHAARAWAQLGVIAGAQPAHDWRDVLTVWHDNGGDIAATYEVARLLEAYDAHHGTANAGWPEGVEILSVETPWAGTLGPLPYTARADAVVRLPDGRIVIPDIKTRSSKLPDDAARRFATRPQFLGLAWLAMQALQLPEPPAVWVDAIIKTKIPRFDRVLVPLTGAAVSAWASNQAGIAEAHERGACAPALRNYSACAPEIGSPCHFFDYCHGSQETRERRFEVQS